MKFSIITPSFQSSDWLKLCIASVADQGVECEHIVQDGGSNDGTLDWLPQDARVRAYVEKDDGMYDAINRGFRKARGDILAHLNCDEQYLPGTLAAVAAFFQKHPEVEVVFADAIVVDTEGNYLWHRKMLPPLLWHTQTCNLSTLTCSMFYRRGIIEKHGAFFDLRWRIVGDGEWMIRLIRSGARMGVLRRFTSVFTNTGDNLSLKAGEETARLHAQAPAVIRLLRPAIMLHHRFRRLTGGIYVQKPFSYELYTRQSRDRRVQRNVERPTSRWRW